MENYDSNMRAAILKVLASQRLAVLSTVRGEQPYASLMAYAHTPDLETLVVATGTATRKFINLSQQPRVSLLVDTRSNCEADFHSAEALTIIGRAGQVEPNELEMLRSLYLERHPYLVDFLSSPATVLIKVKVHHYLLVNRFQNVMEYHPGNEKDIFS
ncbi:pyridoxamine 5'-phosphate oxidase family protein [Desulfogranum marinum]|uniref:pyridoxamine 5'-phosphate oxidase family protein n=1 Tax=Desulfogranum marinum TaxID=453220 RepID=UPI00196389E6|nr:pyridoxamine 5'-phosphate oxidase family protein [Desulfogranum marinum]MBM9515028.1 pyridoxamine 5'-phosphate oxidase family protein [Desulfogranum marinum]